MSFITNHSASMLASARKQFLHLASILCKCFMHASIIVVAVCISKASSKPHFQNFLRRELMICLYGPRYNGDSRTSTDPISACWMLCLPGC